MTLRKLQTPIDLDRLRQLCVCFVVALLPVTLAAAAQTPDTAQDSPEPSTETAPEISSEPDSESSGCPGCGCRGCGQGQRQGGGKGRGHGYHGGGGKGRGPGGQGQGQGAGRGGSGRPEATVIHFLIENHESLKRTVEEIPGGVRTRTVSSEPEIVDAVRVHVRQMVDLIHGGGRIRNWDPLFREIFERREAIVMEISDIDGGVEVVETSEDSQVAKLIRAHAVKVEEFVDRGIEAYREETPIPEDYDPTSR